MVIIKLLSQKLWVKWLHNHGHAGGSKSVFYNRIQF